MEIFKNIATVVGCVSACIGLLLTIIKPLRQWVINSFMQKSQQAKLNDKIDKMDEKIDQLLETNEKMDERMTRVETNVLDNEADRLRSELFDCGNRCRRGIRLHPEEMDHIRAVFTKYSVTLKQNGAGENEYNFICDYYNHQHFPQYHKQNNK